jgi:TRAP-type mannitol/chloroaromatic compound transport system permease large subunit
VLTLSLSEFYSRPLPRYTQDREKIESGEAPFITARVVLRLLYIWPQLLATLTSASIHQSWS